MLKTKCGSQKPIGCVWAKVSKCPASGKALNLFNMNVNISQKSKSLPLGPAQRSLMNSNEDLEYLSWCLLRNTAGSSLIFSALYHLDGFTMSFFCPRSSITDTKIALCCAAQDANRIRLKSWRVPLQETRRKGRAFVTHQKTFIHTQKRWGLYSTITDEQLESSFNESV